MLPPTLAEHLGPEVEVGLVRVVASDNSDYENLFYFAAALRDTTTGTTSVPVWAANGGDMSLPVEADWLSFVPVNQQARSLAIDFGGLEPPDDDFVARVVDCVTPTPRLPIGSTHWRGR